MGEFIISVIIALIVFVVALMLGAKLPIAIALAGFALIVFWLGLLTFDSGLDLFN